ncbi:NTP transferase domain-containing protein [Dissulfurirhabdus thermomarina]|uniref:NTP transferase domain-containing protein n=1 Tax=Dissulfurirhabdus thermomarina TaxID=1765737 RepID=A0A6N9TRE0_DISTH|nr:sugar phosphate nucleotidyltransferase [Dissulfurirhabdus thermomarina]NDY43000.1 NTP transferase domain-containing protein [Dissulfurirhabdus thermomarina]NMX23654.1 NTP transferase domain-containing protein [Dissulfurirhabdus thermomarina]
MQAMILAAGLGTRLRPLTLHTPKPLFPVLGKPLLLRLLETLEAAGAEIVAVNAHHLAHRIEAALAAWRPRFRARVELLVEREILGTGGGVGNALSRLDPGRPLLLVNGDVVTNLDFRRLWDRFAADRAHAVLVVHRRPPFDKLAVRDGRVLGFDAPGPGALAFTGISILFPPLLRRLRGGPGSLIAAFEAALRETPGAIRAARADLPGPGLHPPGGLVWEDIGTPAGYLAAHGRLLEADETRLFLPAGEPPPPADTRVEDWACLGRGVRIGRGVTLRRTVVWNYATVPEGSTLDQCIVTPRQTLCLTHADDDPDRQPRP